MTEKTYEIKPEYIFTPEQIQQILDAHVGGKIKPVNSFIGIDPSINSTGLTYISLLIFNNSKLLIDVEHAIIPPNEVKTRDYVKCLNYDKVVHADRSNTELENARLHNFQAIAEITKDFIYSKIKVRAVGIEGLSYNARSGKKNSSSNVYDLAGLNTLIRDRVTKHLESEVAIGNDVREFVASYPPKTVKAGFIHGNADKKLMYQTFERDYGFSEDEVTMPKGTKENYLFDVADSYAIAKREMMSWLNDKQVFPPPPPKARKPRVVKPKPDVNDK